MSVIRVNCAVGIGKRKIEPLVRPAAIVGRGDDDGGASNPDAFSVGARGMQCARCMWKWRRRRSRRHEREEKRMDETACVMQSRKKSRSK